VTRPAPLAPIPCAACGLPLTRTHHAQRLHQPCRDVAVATRRAARRARPTLTAAGVLLHWLAWYGHVTRCRQCATRGLDQQCDTGAHLLATAVVEGRAVTGR
jgi:hypothetical protein